MKKSKLAEFSQESGFKVLSVMQLGAVEYRVILYLLNCSVSGLDEIITTEEDLASLINSEAQEVHEALSRLSSKAIVRWIYKKNAKISKNDSFRLSLESQVSKWHFDDIKPEITTQQQATLFPFRRPDGHLVQLVKTSTASDHRKKNLPKRPGSVYSMLL